MVRRIQNNLISVMPVSLPSDKKHSFIRSFVAAYAIAVRATEYAGSEDILEDIVERCVLDVRSKRYDAYEGGGGHGDIEYRDGEGYSDMFA